jgi:hypothetical protein
MLWPIFLAGVIAAVIAWFLLARWESAIGHIGLARRLGAVFVPMTIASIVYWIVALLFKVPPALELGALVLQKFRPQNTQKSAEKK